VVTGVSEHSGVSGELSSSDNAPELVVSGRAAVAARRRCGPQGYVAV